jgi:putative transposase
VICYQFRLYPTASQEAGLLATLETCRRFYNDCLAERKAAYETEKRTVTKFEQLRRVKELKATNPYAAGVHSHVLQVVVSDLDKAFQAFFRRVKSGEKAGYPRFKGRDRFDSIGFKENGNGFKVDGRRLKLSGIGRVAVRWHREMVGTVKTLRVCRRAGHWYASFACEVEAEPLPATGEVAGVDVGVASLLTTSDGEHIDNPRWYRAAQAKLRRLQRAVSRKKLGGKNRKKTVRALQTHHQRVRNRRQDFLNKVAHALITRYDGIALEDLRIRNMVRNHYLSKSILDAGWNYLLTRLQAKAEGAARVIELVAPAYTSKTCSACGAVFESLTLSDRWVSCACGLSLCRDHNAARNILCRSRFGQNRWASTQGSSPSVAQEAARL